MASGGEGVKTGRAAVFVLNQFMFRSDARSGGEKDVHNLRKCFVHTFGFRVLNVPAISDKNSGMCLNLRKCEFLHDVDEQSPCRDRKCVICQIKNTDFKNDKVFLLAIASHGKVQERELLVTFKDGCVKVQTILDELSDIKCPALTGMQRVLLLHICRKSQTDPVKWEDAGVSIPIRLKVTPKPAQALADRLNTPLDRTYHDGIFDGVFVSIRRTGDQIWGYLGVALRDDTHAQSQSGSPDVSMAVETFERLKLETDKALKQLNLPKDFLIVFPTTEGRAAYNNKGVGSWLIHAIATVVDKHFMENRSVNLLKLLTMTASYTANEMQTTVPSLDEDGHVRYVVIDNFKCVLEDEDLSRKKCAVEIVHKLTKPILLPVSSPKMEDEEPNLDTPVPLTY